MPKVKATKGKSTKEKVYHPQSRKASRMVRRMYRETKLAKKKKAANIKLGYQGEKMLWFRDRLDPELSSYSNEDVLVLVEKYLSRYDEELHLIGVANKIPHRSQQYVAREDCIKFTLERDRAAFQGSGLEIPDLLSEENVELLRDWNGEVRFLDKIKTTRVTRSRLCK